MALPWRRFEPEDLTDSKAFLKLRGDAALLYTLLAMRVLRHGALEPDVDLYRGMWSGRLASNFDDAWRDVVRVLPASDDGLLHVDWAEDALADSMSRTKSETERKRHQRSQAAERDVPPPSRGTPEGQTRESRGSPAPRARATDVRTDETDNSGASHLSHRSGPELFPGSEEPKPKRRNGHVQPIAALVVKPAAVEVVAEVVEPPSDHKLFIEFWCKAFEQVTGRKYAFAGGMDGKLVQGMLKRCGSLADLKDRALRILADPPGWIAKDGCVDLATLSRCLNQVVSKGHVKELTPLDKRILEVKSEKRRIEA